MAPEKVQKKAGMKTKQGCPAAEKSGKERRRLEDYPTSVA